MCEPGPRFKLCSCAKNEIGKSFWELTRGNSHEQTHWVGDIINPKSIHEARVFDPHTFISNRFAHDLNTSKIFDFDYKPIHGDLLTVKFDEELIEFGLYLEFVFANGRFVPVNNDIQYNADGYRIKTGSINQTSQ